MSGETLYYVEKVELNTGKTVDRLLTNRKSVYREYLRGKSLSVGYDESSINKTPFKVYDDGVYAFICKEKPITAELLLNL